MSNWIVEPIASAWILAVIFTLIIAVGFIQPKARQLTPFRRRTLLGFRSLALLVLFIGALRPGCVRTIEKDQTATIVFVFDQSRSMTLPHEGGGLTRWQKLQEVLQAASDQLAAIGKKLTVKAYGFDGRTFTLEEKDGKFVLPELPDGGQTDISVGISQPLEQLQGERIVSFLLFSDGVQNCDDPALELPRAAALLDQMELPLITFPFGKAGDANQLTDIAVTNLPDQFAVFVKNRLNVPATILIRGAVNQEIPVQLIVIDSKGAEKVVDTQRISAKRAEEQIPINFQYIPDTAGEFRLVVRAEQLPREAVTLNNELPAFLTVYDGGLRVLYLDGGLQFEQKYLRKSLAASQDIEVDFFWVDHRNREKWPLDLTTQISSGRYDVFVFGDLDSRALHSPGKFEGNLKALAEQIEKGKGLLMLGGYHSFGPGRYHNTPLSDYLPIEMQRYEAQDFNAPLNRSLHIERPINLQPTEPHYLTNLGLGNNEEAWGALPPLLGMNRFAGVKPRSQVLLETKQAEPVLVVGNYGGRVAAFAGDSTWRWVTHGKGDIHKRFWRQVILWLAGLDGQNRSNIWIELSQRRFNQGVDVPLLFGARTSAGEPINDAKFELKLTPPDGAEVLLGSYQGGESTSAAIEKSQLLKPGLYIVKVDATQNGKGLGSTTAQFVVIDDDREKANSVADPDQLTRLADQTKEWGGKTVPPDELSKVLDEINNMPLDLKIEIPQRWQLGDNFLDGALYLCIFAAVIGLEWFLRKKWGLV